MITIIQNPTRIPKLFVMDKTSPIYRTNHSGRFFKISLVTRMVDEVDLNHKIWLRHKVSYQGLRKYLSISTDSNEPEFRKATKNLADQTRNIIDLIKQNRKP